MTRQRMQRTPIRIASMPNLTNAHDITPNISPQRPSLPNPPPKTINHPENSACKTTPDPLSPIHPPSSPNETQKPAAPRPQLAPARTALSPVVTKTAPQKCPRQPRLAGRTGALCSAAAARDTLIIPSAGPREEKGRATRGALGRPGDSHAAEARL